MATDEEYERAVVAVRNGTASKHQEELARRQAKQAGSWGQQARDAFRDKKS